MMSIKEGQLNNYNISIQYNSNIAIKKNMKLYSLIQKDVHKMLLKRMLQNNRHVLFHLVA